MDLITARLITNKSQLDIERDTGVFQTKLSRFEKSGIECIRDDEKKKIEKYLELNINWETEKGKPSLTAQEWSATKSFINHFMKKHPEETKKWITNYKTSRDLHDAVIEVFNDTTIKILGVRYPDGTGIPDVPVLKFDKGGKRK